MAKIKAANRSFHGWSISLPAEQESYLSVAAGQTLKGIPDIGLLLVLSTRNGRPVYVRDVAKVIVGTEPANTPVCSSMVLASHGKEEGSDDHEC